MMIDLTHINASEGEIEFLKSSFVYQPYKLPGPIYTGSGLSMCKSTPLRHIREDSNDPDRDRFINEARNQGAMYEQFIDAVDQRLGIKGMSFFDMACNSGYFCYRMSQRGAVRSVGLDVGDYAETFDLVNEALGTTAEFAPGSYDMRRHEIVGVNGTFDIIFNTAFMCHSSDPTFLLDTLAQMAKKALLIFSKFTRDDEYVVRFSKITSRYFKQPYPICFDATTEISDSLLLFAFEQMGFPTVIEIEQQPTWLPRSPGWRAFLAVRS